MDDFKRRTAVRACQSNSLIFLYNVRYTDELNVVDRIGVGKADYLLTAKGNQPDSPTSPSGITAVNVTTVGFRAMTIPHGYSAQFSDTPLTWNVGRCSPVVWQAPMHEMCLFFDAEGLPGALSGGAQCYALPQRFA